MTVTALSAIPSRQMPTGLIPLVINDTGSSITLLTPTTGNQWDVWGYDLTTNGITDLTFLSGSTPVSGPIGYGASSGPSGLFYPIPKGRPEWDWFFARFTMQTAGDLLILSNSGAGIRVSGTVWVSQSPIGGR